MELNNEIYHESECKKEFIIDKSKYEDNNVYINNFDSEYVKIKDFIYKVKPDKENKLNVINLNMYQRMKLELLIGSKIYVNKVGKKDLLGLDTLKIQLKSTNKNKKRINKQEFLLNIKKMLENIPLISNQIYYYKEDIILEIELEEGKNNRIIVENTEIELFSKKDNLIIYDENMIDKENMIDEENENSLFKKNFNFLEMGIGGLDKQFELIFRRAFTSRLIEKETLNKLGINHVRGILLHGPPGTGKTLCARQIGKILNCEEPEIVNGPSLLGKYVGESEENVRKLFEKAIEDKENKKLHLIICDEFDAIAKKRGMTINDNGVSDKIVNQFLTMIDGPNPLNNILLICITNRIDIIDEALLRPGRLELQIEVNLPDAKGRKEILSIHTKKMIESGYVKEINLDEIVERTKNFTGAELESVVKNAVSFNLSKEIKLNGNNKNINPLIKQEDLLKSIEEINPKFGKTSKEINLICNKRFDLYSNDYKKVYEDINKKINELESGNLLSILIQGDKYVGKTTLACNIAKESNYSCIKLVNAELLLNNNKEQLLYEKFDDGYKSDNLILILDSIEEIIEYSKLGNIYSNKILQIIYILLNKVIEKNKKVVILLTSNNKQLMNTIDILSRCNYIYNINDTTTAESNNLMISEYFKKKKFNI
jgi:vesicle-fusing ATPase